MFQIWLGPRPGTNSEILEEETLSAADNTARRRVLAAKEQRQSMIATIFDFRAGTVVSGFATPDLADDVSGFSRVQVL